ncbi:hypothetical protein GCM10020295_52490 [Streptomyces cinereospinus]
MHTAGAGVDHLMCPEPAASGTVVTDARGVVDQPVAEYVAGLVPAMAKDLPRTPESQRERTWRHRDAQRVPARERRHGRPAGRTRRPVRADVRPPGGGAAAAECGRQAARRRARALTVTGAAVRGRAGGGAVKGARPPGP